MCVCGRVSSNQRVSLSARIFRVNPSGVFADFCRSADFADPPILPIPRFFRQNLTALPTEFRPIGKFADADPILPIFPIRNCHPVLYESLKRHLLLSSEHSLSSLLLERSSSGRFSGEGYTNVRGDSLGRGRAVISSASVFLTASLDFSSIFFAKKFHEIG